MVSATGRSGVSDVGECLGGDHGCRRISIFGTQRLTAIVVPIFGRYGTHRSPGL